MNMIPMRGQCFILLYWHKTQPYWYIILLMCLRFPYILVSRANTLLRNLCQKLSYEAEHMLKHWEQSVSAEQLEKYPHGHRNPMWLGARGNPLLIPTIVMVLWGLTLLNKIKNWERETLACFSYHTVPLRTPSHRENCSFMVCIHKL